MNLTSFISNNVTGTDTGTTTGGDTAPTTDTTPVDTGISGNSNFPAIDPNGETLELEGTITEVFSDHFVIEGITIWFDSSATFKYEAGHSLSSGESAQVEAVPNVDDSGTAIKVQVGPL